MYYINKIVGFLVSPIGGAIAGGVIAVVCARLGRKRLAKWIGGLTVAWLWLWMTPIMTWVVGVPLEREFLVDGKVPLVESFPEADAIVLLGGGISSETNLSPYAEMALSADRVWQAARLFNVGKAPRIIATGFAPKVSTLPLLADFGLPKDCTATLSARNTEEEAKGILAMLSSVDGIPSISNHESRAAILLVTSAWHMKRARLMFVKYATGIDVICAPADFEYMMMTKGISFPRALLPDPNAFMLNSVAFHEWVGIVGYTIFR